MASLRRREVLFGLSSVALAQVVFSRVGPAFAADKIKPSASSALVVVDVQNCFLPGGSLAVKDGDKVVPVINTIAKSLRQCGDDAGLAHAAPCLVRVEPRGQEAVRSDQARLRRSGAVAGSLRAGHARRRDCPRTSSIPKAELDHPQGLPQRRRQLFGVSGGRQGDARRASPATSRSAASTRSSSPASPPISASPGPRSMPRMPAWTTYVVEDACRGIDVGGSLAKAWADMDGRRGQADSVERYRDLTGRPAIA